MSNAIHENFLTEFQALLRKYDAEFVMRGNPKSPNSEIPTVEFRVPGTALCTSLQLKKWMD